MNSQLSDLLAEGEPLDKVGNALQTLLSEGAPKAPRKSRSKKFKPKFNVREEFVLWVNDQFPELSSRVSSEKSYSELSERMKEVKEAAKKAYDHISQTTTQCSNSTSYRYWNKLDSCDETGDEKRFITNLDAFVQTIENFSMSLGGDPYFSKKSFNVNIPVHTKFEVKKRHWYDFRDWLQSNFPFVPSFDFTKENLKLLKKRADEIVKALDTVEKVDVNGKRSQSLYGSICDDIRKCARSSDYDVMARTLYDLHAEIKMEIIQR